MDYEEENLQYPAVTHRLFQWITSMSDDERRTLLKLLEDGLLRGKCRRGFFRKALRLPVTYTVGVRAYRDFIKDISLGGVFIFTSIPFKIGQQIRLVFRKKDTDNPVTVLGKIARVTPEGIGVEFFHPDVDKITAIVSSASEG